MIYWYLQCPYIKGIPERTIFRFKDGSGTHYSFNVTTKDNLPIGAYASYKSKWFFFFRMKIKSKSINNFLFLLCEVSKPDGRLIFFNTAMAATKYTNRGFKVEINAPVFCVDFTESYATATSGSAKRLHILVVIKHSYTQLNSDPFRNSAWNISNIR